MKLRYIILAWIPAIICLFAIFYFSSENSIQSDGFSLKVTSNIVNNFAVDANDKVVETTLISKFNNVIRNIGHTLEYFLLSLALMIPLYVSNLRKWKLPLVDFVVCFLYGCSDEIHQMYIEGRAAEITDLILDCFGILLGILTFYLIYFVYTNIAYKITAKKSISTTVEQID